MKSVVLCYNLKGTKQGRKLGILCSFLGFRVKYVDKEEYDKPIGALTGLDVPELEETVSEDAGFDEEMIVIQLTDNGMLDKLLHQMRKEKINIPLKAIVTTKNVKWDSVTLYHEIKREHEAMMKQNAERK